jgi:hypothetical protein
VCAAASNLLAGIHQLIQPEPSGTASFAEDRQQQAPTTKRR